MNKTPSTGELARLPLSEVRGRLGARTLGVRTLGAPPLGARTLGACMLGDAAVAAVPAKTACRAAEVPAEINLRITGDPGLEEAGRPVQTATVASQHALATARES